jgi:hypothetical protein
MTHSVWNQGANRYDYYETGKTRNEYNEGVPRHLHPTRLGMSPEQAAWPLPSGAKYVGSGIEARGRISSRNGMTLGVFEDMSLTKAAFLGFSAFLIWKYVR